ncbi:hypothetical protein E8E11_000309 [Didymella keratinophila]|nr:hypothetical protein E8E11_000309 [Didymella keratinophila]
MRSDQFLTHDSTGTLAPPVSGKHYISLATLGNTKVYINDDLVGRVPNVAGQSYRIRLEAHTVEDPDIQDSFLSKCLGFTFGFMAQHLMEADLLQEAVDAAKASDVALVFVGNTPAWDTEGADRETMDLPHDGLLNRLVSAVAKVNSKTVVVNSSVSPITMPWLDDVSAVLQAWFPGQEAGHSIADVIFGSRCPGGKLPVTFPRCLSDAPALNNFLGNLEANYVEYKGGFYIGYRHYDRKPETALFPFGIGLSYTTIDVSNVSLSSATLGYGQNLNVIADDTNTGKREGSKVVQVYLKGYAKVHLAAKVMQSVSISLNTESFAYFNEGKGN